MKQDHLPEQAVSLEQVESGTWRIKIMRQDGSDGIMEEVPAEKVRELASTLYDIEVGFGRKETVVEFEPEKTKRNNHKR